MLPFAIIPPSTLDYSWIGSALIAVDDSIIRNNSSSDLLNNTLSKRGLINGSANFPFINAGGIKFQELNPNSANFGYLGIVSMPLSQDIYTSWSMDVWMSFNSSFITGDGIGLIRGYDNAGYVNLILQFTTGTSSSLYLQLADNSSSVLIGNSNTFGFNSIQPNTPFHIAMNSSSTLFELFLNGIKVFTITNSSLCLRIRDKVYNAQPFNNTPLRPVMQYYGSGTSKVETFNRVRIFSGMKFTSTGFSLNNIYKI